jgi:DNA-binding transcriptional regulator GbsR (MarR family)
MSDVWELFRVILEQRKQRELNPTLLMLRDVAVEVDSENQTDPVTKERIQNMLQFIESTSDWYENIQAVPTPTLQKLMKLGTGITKALKK